MQIYSGSSNPALAASLSKHLGAQLGRVQYTRFESDESRAYITETHVEKNVIVVQSLSMSADRHLMELLTLSDALLRRGARKITAVIPYMGYARQNQVFREGESLSAEVVARVLATGRFARIITFDIHSNNIISMYPVPVISLSPISLFSGYIKKQNTVIVAPDGGATTKVKELAKVLKVKTVTLTKERNRTTGKVKLQHGSGVISGKNAIIVDDMVATGETILQSTEYLYHQGAQSVTVFATHFLGVPGVADKLQTSPIDRVVITNTITQVALPAKFAVIDCASVLAEALAQS